MTRHIALSVCLGIALLHTAPAPAQAPATAPATRPLRTGPEVIKMRLHPMATTQPALQHRLLPDVIDRVPGNGASLYMIAARVQPDAKAEDEIWNKYPDFDEMPLDQVARRDIDGFLAHFSERLRYVELASHRQTAQWDTDLRERGFYAMLPYLNDMKTFCTLLAIQARGQLAKGDWAAAEHTLRCGFAMSRHLNSESLFIQGLIGSGIAQKMLSVVQEDWIANGDSPNLYWALTSLPSPLVDPATIAQGERADIYFTIPELRQAAAGRLLPQQWPGLIRNIARLSYTEKQQRLGRAAQLADAEKPADIDAEAKLLLDTMLPRASRYLLSSGTPAGKVAAMSPEQIVGTYLVQEYCTAADEAWKGWELPFWQAPAQPLQAEMEKADMARAGNQRQAFSDNPLIETLPSLWRARYSFARGDWTVAQLRTIEALRDYAARHDGRPPQRLDQITDLPIPIDPFTGKPLEYRLEGQTVILLAPAPAGHPTTSGRRFEITFGK